MPYSPPNLWATKNKGWTQS